MGTCLQQWFLDPLFASAEEVQDSADRLESNFRTWLQEAQDAQGISRVQQDSETQRLRLMSSCDTLRWQLEVFERAVRTDKSTSGDPAIDAAVKARRQDFVAIIRQQLHAIENHVRRSPATPPNAAVSRATGAATSMPSASRAGTFSGTVEAESTGRMAASASADHLQSCPRPVAPREIKHEHRQRQDGARLSSFVVQDSAAAARLSDKAIAVPSAVDVVGPRSQLSCSPSDEVISPAARSELSGFFGASSWTSSPRSVDGWSSVPNNGILSQPEPGLPEGETERLVDARLVQVMDVSSRGGQGLNDGTYKECDGSGEEPEPIGMGKTFPSLVSYGYTEGSSSTRSHTGSGFAGLSALGGAAAGVQGWQCLLLWVQHLQRATRRRRLTDSPGGSAGGEGGVAGEPRMLFAGGKMKDEEPGKMRHMMVGSSSAMMMRNEAPMANLEIRTSRSASGIAAEHSNGSPGDWHFDIPSPGLDQDCGMGKGLQGQGQGQAWGATGGARHRRQAVHPRPGRPYSSVGLVCAVAMLMLVLACYCTLSGHWGLDRRDTSLMETSSQQASSPSFN